MDVNIGRIMKTASDYICQKMDSSYKSIPAEDPSGIPLAVPPYRRSLERGQTSRASMRRKAIPIFCATVIVILTYINFSGGFVSASPTSSCDSVSRGYQCEPEISHFWGQNSPYFSVNSDIPATIPKSCKLTFAQVLSRHGARDPTASKTKVYNETIQQIQNNVQSYHGKYKFLEDFEYTLGADLLTVFGQMQMVNSGVEFYGRYATLANSTTPFVRASGEQRVIDSAMNWTQGFHQAKLADSGTKAPDNYPFNIVVISEDDDSNNTLNHGLCTDFENGYLSEISDKAQGIWADIFTPAITGRLNANLAGANLTQTQTIYMMDLCSFVTVASPTGQVSDFCALFSAAEWRGYDYFQSLGKYYGYGAGNPLGPTQGVGFANELVARMTRSAVRDHTSTNATLDDSQATFPTGANTTLYADFSHDNTMTSIFAALGFYNATSDLSNTTVETTRETEGYSASWTVPFAGRAYVEKMKCAGSDDELVRVLVNDRVLPLKTCSADSLGRCTLDDFVESLTFTEEGGKWDQCFI